MQLELFRNNFAGMPGGTKQNFKNNCGNIKNIQRALM